MKPKILAVATLGLLCAGAHAGSAAERPELVVDTPANVALCPPCMGLWATNVAPGAAVKFVVMDAGASPLPIELETFGHDAGIGFGAYRPTQRSVVSVFAVVDGQQTDVSGCLPPIRPSVGDCPPPPGKALVHAAVGPRLEVPVDPEQPPFAGAALQRLDQEPARWTRVPATVQYSDRPAPHVTFNAEVGAGLYRAQFMDEAGHVLTEQLVRVGDDPRP